MSDFNIIVKGLVYTAILMYAVCSRQITCVGIKKPVIRNITNLYILYYPFIVHLKINIFQNGMSVIMLFWSACLRWAVHR